MLDRKCHSLRPCAPFLHPPSQSANRFIEKVGLAKHSPGLPGYKYAWDAVQSLQDPQSRKTNRGGLHGGAWNFRRIANKWTTSDTRLCALGRAHLPPLFRDAWNAAPREMSGVNQTVHGSFPSLHELPALSPIVVVKWWFSSVGHSVPSLQAETPGKV